MGLKPILFCLSFVWILAIPCEVDSKTTPADTPEQAVQLWTRSLHQYQPQLIWEALPPAYQKTLHNIIITFSQRIDNVIYQQTLATLKQFVQVLQTRQDFILNSSFLMPFWAAQPPAHREKWAQQWQQWTVLLQWLLNHQSLMQRESLQKLVIPVLLKQFGPVLQQTATRLQIPPLLGAIQTLKTLTVNTDEALIETIDETGQRNHWKMRQVDGYWVPETWALDWQPRLVAIQQVISNWQPETLQPYYKQWHQALPLINQSLSRLFNSQTQAQFDQALLDFFINLIALPGVNGILPSAPGPALAPQKIN